MIHSRKKSKVHKNDTILVLIKKAYWDFKISSWMIDLKAWFMFWEKNIVPNTWSCDMVNINDKNIIMNEPACCWNGWRFYCKQCKKTV